MAAADSDTGTRIDEIADGIFRLCTPVPPSAFPGGFTFNQYLVLDDDPPLHLPDRGVVPAAAGTAVRVPIKLAGRPCGKRSIPGGRTTQGCIDSSKTEAVGAG